MIERRPYTYILEWTLHKKRYIGARWAKGCDPNDLWSKYFTSSIHVKNFVKQNGPPDLILIDQVFDNANDAIRREDFLLRQYDAGKNSLFLNKAVGAVYNFNDPDIRARQAKSRVGTKHTAESKAKIGAASKGRTFTPEALEKMRLKALGHTRNRGRKWSEESKKRHSEIQRKSWISGARKRDCVLKDDACDKVIKVPIIQSTELQILEV